MTEPSFRGASTHSLDEKSRLIVPRRFQETLTPESDTNYVLTASPDGCLLLLDEASFGQIRHRLGDDPLDRDRRTRGLRRLLLGHAEDVRPDKAGRIVIPETLRHFMGLGSGLSKEVVVVGTGSAIELWATDRWNRALTADSSSLSETETVAT